MDGLDGIRASELRGRPPLACVGVFRIEDLSFIWRLGDEFEIGSSSPLMSSDVGDGLKLLAVFAIG